MPKHKKHQKQTKPRQKIMKQKTIAKIVKKTEENHITTGTIFKIDQFFPDRLRCKLKDSATILFTAVGGTPNAFVMAGNYLHNNVSPLLSAGNTLSTSVGNSIYGLGNLLSIDAVNASTGPYIRYRILSSAIKVEIASNNTTATNGDFILFPCTQQEAPDFGIISAVNSNSYNEFPYNKHKLIGVTNNRGIVFKSSMSTSRMYGLKYKSALEGSEYVAYEGVNPANQWQWNMVWVPFVAVDAPIRLQVTIEYWCEFFDRNVLAPALG